MACATLGPAIKATVARDFKGQKVTAETVMTRAGLNSDKPNDIFKVRTGDKGEQQYEDQHHAYVTLVKSHKRDGLYWMPCAGGAVISA